MVCASQPKVIVAIVVSVIVVVVIEANAIDRHFDRVVLRLCQGGVTVIEAVTLLAHQLLLKRVGLVHRLLLR
jgi:hypothetical protein